MQEDAHQRQHTSHTARTLSLHLPAYETRLHTVQTWVIHKGAPYTRAGRYSVFDAHRWCYGIIIFPGCCSVVTGGIFNFILLPT